MNIVQLLQQGGYILPQYSQGSISYQPSNVGAETNQFLNQLSQQEQQLYFQHKQARIQDQQANQSMINSVIDNRIKQEQATRLNKQMELSNAKLEFDMKKTAINELQEMMKWDEDNILPGDRAKVEEVYKQLGIDDSSIMKSNFDMDFMMKANMGRRTATATMTNALKNKQTSRDVSKFLDNQKPIMEQAIKLSNENILDPDAYIAYMNATNKVAGDLQKFMNGQLAGLDLNSPEMTLVSSFPDLINEVALKQKGEMVKREQESKLATDEANIKLRDIQGQSALINAEADLLTAQARMSLIPSEIEENKAQAANYKELAGQQQMYQDLLAKGYSPEDAIRTLKTTYSNNTSTSTNTFIGTSTNGKIQGKPTGTKDEYNFGSYTKKGNEITSITVNGTTFNSKNYNTAGVADGITFAEVALPSSIKINGVATGEPHPMININLDSEKGGQFIESYLDSKDKEIIREDSTLLPYVVLKKVFNDKYKKENKKDMVIDPKNPNNVLTKAVNGLLNGSVLSIPASSPTGQSTTNQPNLPVNTSNVDIDW